MDNDKPTSMQDFVQTMISTNSNRQEMRETGSKNQMMALECFSASLIKNGSFRRQS